MPHLPDSIKDLVFLVLQSSWGRQARHYHTPVAKCSGIQETSPFLLSGQQSCAPIHSTDQLSRQTNIVCDRLPQYYIKLYGKVKVNCRLTITHSDEPVVCRLSPNRDFNYYLKFGRHNLKVLQHNHVHIVNTSKNVSYRTYRFVLNFACLTAIIH